MKVLKFGGSSVANATRISAVMDIVRDCLASDTVVLVCSAISGCTDALLKIGASSDSAEREALISALKDRHLHIANRLFTGKEKDSIGCELTDLFQQISLGGDSCIEAYGEILLTRIIARKFLCEGVEAEWLDSRKLIRVGASGAVDSPQSYASISSACRSPKTRLFVAPGFIASDCSGRTTTLGRGGSDYSAALYAAALKADSLQIWTDVPGIMTANPKDVPAARTIPTISYQAALTMAEHGAKVLYAPTVQPAMDAGIDIQILSTFQPKHSGTIICELREPAAKLVGVSSMQSGAGRSRLCLVGEGPLRRDAALARIERALSQSGLCPLGGILGKGAVFEFEVSSAIEKAALAAIHHEFFEDISTSELELYIAGFGAVGKALLSLIEQSRERVAERKGKSIKIVGLASSSSYVFDPKGLSSESAAPALGLAGRDCAEQAAGKGSDFVEEVAKRAGKGSVFADCTDSTDLYKGYPRLFAQGISVVTSNRRSIAIPYAEYLSLRRLAAQNGCFFRYSTTVGASLPILESIASSENCSDAITGIEAVVSCTINQILSSYRGSGGQSFASLLRSAQQSGLSEEDPRTDLGGQDVLRKLLILGREAGLSLDAEQVCIKAMLGDEYFCCSLEEFYCKLEAAESLLASHFSELEASGLRERFVASLQRDSSAASGFRAEISIVAVAPSSPFYWISGTENVIVVRSEHSAPLVIKGAGEGPLQAATGLIKDILA